MAIRSVMSSAAFQELRKVLLRPVVQGRLTGEPIAASSIFDENPLTLVYILCRAEGRELAELQKSGRIRDVPLMGIIKEVSPQDDKSIETDELGVIEFQNKYFDYPVYQDETKAFYNALGRRKLTSYFSWNPFSWYSFIRTTSRRTTDVGITGNMKGEGIILGGVLVISKEKGVVFQYEEETGDPVPVEEIVEAILANSN